MSRLFALAAITICLNSLRAADPEIISVEKIWDQGKHNAFTDLIRWHDKWYCTFRESDAHVGGDGQLRVLESADWKKWESVALVGEKGIDLRDPKLSITPDDRLMIVAGGSVYEGKTLKGRQPRVTFSKDAKIWTAPERVLTEGEWLWRVTWHGGVAYGVTYNANERKSKEAIEAAKEGKAPPGPADWKLKLVSSSDGVKYSLVTHLDVPGHPNETTLRFMPDGEMVALVRREGGNTFGWIGRSKAPYKEWTWSETKHRLGGPNFIRLPDGSLWAAGRSYPGGAKTVLARMTAAGAYDPVLTFPSGGDTSYPGMVWHDGRLWMSYYASHKGKSAIYVARVRIPLEAEDIGSRRELFVDDYLIAPMSSRLTLKVQQPVPKEVVLTADKPWEGNTSAYYTVFADGDKCRMYYRGSNWDPAAKKATHREVTCYAESKDGITWTKPELGLFEFDGSKANNIVWDGSGTHNFTPFLDTNPKCPKDARYKALAGGRGGLLAYQSADGIHWKPMRDTPVITKGAFDSQNLAFWDAHAGMYREYHRHFRVVRDIMTGTSADFLNWTEPKWLDYPNASPEHLYTNAVQPCPNAPHILIGFPTRFLPAKEQTEPIFMASRDGQTFRRYPEAVIPTTAPEHRDGNRSNYMANGVLKLPGKPDELTVYGKERYYTGPGSRLRRFVYRVDGFVALHAGPDEGALVTRPVKFKGSRLVVNYRTGEKGFVRVDVLDTDFHDLPGLTGTLTGDNVAATVAWKEGAELSAIAGKPVRLRFRVKDAEVFSFRFE